MVCAFFCTIIITIYRNGYQLDQTSELVPIPMYLGRGTMGLEIEIGIRTGL